MRKDLAQTEHSLEKASEVIGIYMDIQDTALLEYKVYFIQAGTEGPIKIGISKDVQERIRSIQDQVWEEVNLIGILQGGEALENAIHVMFLHLKIRGEWFEPDRELLDWINENA